MTVATKRISFGIIGAVVIAAAVIGIYYARSGKTAPALVPASADPAGRARQVVAGLAYLDLHSAELSPSNAAGDLPHSFPGEPAKVLEELQKRITLVPYDGSLVDPAQLLPGGTANTLDRARLLQDLLHKQGVEAQIVSLAQDGKTAVVKYAAATPGGFPAVAQSVIDPMRKEVADLAPAILAKLGASQAPGDWAGALTGAAPEKRLYWVRYQQAGKSIDLVPQDTTLDANQLQSAEVLSAEKLAQLVWQVKLTIANSVAGNPADQDVLTFSQPASSLTGVALTFANRPDESQQFVPCLFFGDKAPLTGAPFAGANNGELDHQVLKIDMTGPDQTRHFVRTLVGPKAAGASPAERLLEIATVARITVVSGPISDEAFERIMASNLAQTAKLMFAKPGADQNAGHNLASVPAIAALDASHRYAGHLGDASQHVLAFQGRPAIALERDFTRLDASGNQLLRKHSFDLIDPGHAIYASDASLPKDTMVRAAIEQSIVDSQLEDSIAKRSLGQGSTAVTSHDVLNQLISSGAGFSMDKPLAGLAGDSYSAVQPAYRLAALSQDVAAGWRFEAGPQVVPVLGNLTGGTETDTPAKRVDRLCGLLSPWGVALVSAEVFPPKILLGGLVKYDCALAKAYFAAACKMDAIAQMIGGGAPSSCNGMSDEDFRKMIEGMGPDLMKDIIFNALTQAGVGTAIHGLFGGHNEESLVSKVLHRVLDAGGEITADKIREAVQEVLNDEEKGSHEGKSVDQVEHDVAGTLVR